MIRLFEGRQVENHYASDISLVLHPLPKVPILICYWKPENGLESDLNIFFDSTAEQNLNIESIFTLGTGLVHVMPSATLVDEEDRTDTTANAGFGARYYLTDRFLLRGEYRRHKIFTSRDDNEDISEWKIGFAFFY